MNPSEIVFVAPSLSGGGAERVSISLAHYFIENGYKFSFLLTKSKAVSYRLDPRVCVIDKFASPNLKPFQQILLIYKIMIEHPDAIFISFLPHQNLYTLIAKLFARNKVIISIRNDPRRDFGSHSPLFFLRNLLYRFANAVVFQTYEQHRLMNFINTEKSFYILNPLTSDLPQASKGSKSKRIISVGRLVDQKNHEMTIRAFSILQKRHPDYSLHIYGEGPNRPSLENVVKDLGVNSSVAIHHFSNDILNQINDSAIYVSSSDYEGLSNSMLEAMSLGIPSICTKCSGGGTEMVIEDGVNGCLIECGDVEALAGKLSILIEDKDLYNSISHHSLLLKNKLDVSTIGKQWLEVVNLLNN